MRDLRPPKVPETPDFIDRVERLLRRATRDRVRVPRLQRFGLRWSAAPAGTAVMAVLAVSFFLNVAQLQGGPSSSLPHWTAPETTVTTVAASGAVSPGFATRRITAAPAPDPTLIDGRFERDDLRPESEPAPPTPSTIPQ